MEARVQGGVWVAGVSERSGDLAERTCGSNLRLVTVAEVDAGEDAQGSWGHCGHGVDPLSSVGDEGVASGSTVKRCDKSVDEIEVQDRVVTPEGEGIVGDSGWNLGGIVVVARTGLGAGRLRGAGRLCRAGSFYGAGRCRRAGKGTKGAKARADAGRDTHVSKLLFSRVMK